MKKLIKIFLILFIPLLLLLIYLFYSSPIFVEINPFYISQPIEGWSEDIFKKDFTPKVVANTPSGWKIQTLSQKIMASSDSDDLVIEGLTGIPIYREGELISKIYAVGDTGGMGALFYKFPDYDPEIYESLEVIGDDFKTIIEVNKGEYTEVELFGENIRRVENRYIQNDSETPEKYFGNIGTLFHFHFKDPLFEYCYNISEEVQQESGINPCSYNYGIYVKEGIEQEDLIILDSILESMRIR